MIVLTEVVHSRVNELVVILSTRCLPLSQRIGRHNQLALAKLVLTQVLFVSCRSISQLPQGLPATVQ
jgi:hypothetical protein